jgi:hypothetical protein
VLVVLRDIKLENISYASQLVTGISLLPVSGSNMLNIETI